MQHNDVLALSPCLAQDGEIFVVKIVTSRDHHLSAQPLWHSAFGVTVYCRDGTAILCRNDEGSGIVTEVCSYGSVGVVVFRCARDCYHIGDIDRLEVRYRNAVFLFTRNRELSRKQSNPASAGRALSGRWGAR